MTQTLVFVDRSASAQVDSSTRVLFADSLAGLVSSSLMETGDQLSVFPVHHKTASKVGRWDTENDVVPPQPKDFADEQRQDTIRYMSQHDSFVEDATKRAVSQFDEQASRGEFGRWTDLWSTLGVASEEIQDDASRVQVYYFSDMFESMPGDERRNFDREPPTSRSQAEEWAEEDVERLEDYLDLDRDKLGKVHVRILQGKLATKSNAQNVKFYWQRLFEEAGIAPGNIQYN